jgi:hypothetical protein
MNELSVHGSAFPAMSDEAIHNVAMLQDVAMSAEQLPVATGHVLHAGMYARTMTLPAGHVLVGTLVQVATIVIFNGDADVFVGDTTIRLTGYHVIPASAMRKQVYLAHADCTITAIFPTEAGSVEAAEDEATGEASLLLSRRPEAQNIYQIEGGHPCLSQQQ